MSEQVLNNQMQGGMKSPDANRRPRSSKRKNAGKLRLVGGLMLIVGTLAILMCLLLVILPCFRVSKVEVRGIGQHTEDEILAAAGVNVGDELFALDWQSIADRVFDKCAYVDQAHIRIKFPFTVQITVEELDPSQVMYTKFNNGWISFDRSFRVLSQGMDEADFSSFLKVELPEIASMSVGGEIRFRNADADLSYIGDALNLLDRVGTRQRVTALDVSSKFRVSYVLGDSCQVILGKLGDLDTKLLLADQILESRNPLAEISSVVDVSDISKCTYRELRTQSA